MLHSIHNKYTSQHRPLAQQFILSPTTRNRRLFCRNLCLCCADRPLRPTRTQQVTHCHARVTNVVTRQERPLCSLRGLVYIATALMLTLRHEGLFCGHTGRFGGNTGKGSVAHKCSHTNARTQRLAPQRLDPTLLISISIHTVTGIILYIHVTFFHTFDIYIYIIYIYQNITFTRTAVCIAPHTLSLTPPHVYTNIQRVRTHTAVCYFTTVSGLRHKDALERLQHTATHSRLQHTATHSTDTARNSRGLKRLGQEAVEVKGTKTRLKIQMHLVVAHCALKRLLSTYIMICHEL